MERHWKSLVHEYCSGKQKKRAHPYLLFSDNFFIFFSYFFSAPYDALVVKASGLAAGKGVVVANNRDEACAAVDEILGDKKYGSAGSTIVVEEKLSGEEVSVCKIHF